MGSTIELSTAPAKFSMRANKNGRFAAILIVAVILVQLAGTTDIHGWNWQDLLLELERIPARILAAQQFGFIVVLLISPLVIWLTLKGAQLDLHISAQSVVCTNRLPTWAKSLQADWHVERNQILSVCVDMSRVSGQPRAARVRFETRQGSKAVPLFGWHRLGQSVDNQRIQSKRDFLTGRWQGDLETFPIIQALREADIEFTVDAKPVADPLRKSPQGWFIALGSIIAVAYGLYAVINCKF